MKIHGLVRKAVNSRSTIPAEVDSAERSLVVVSGPPSEFSRKGLRRAREWLERETDIDRHERRASRGPSGPSSRRQV